MSDSRAARRLAAAEVVALDVFLLFLVFLVFLALRRARLLLVLVLLLVLLRGVWMARFLFKEGLVHLIQSCTCLTSVGVKSNTTLMVALPVVLTKHNVLWFVAQANNILLSFSKQGGDQATARAWILWL